MRVGSPKKSTCTPVRVRSRSAIRHTTLLSRSRSTSTSNGGRSPPVSGQHLEAQALPVGDEPAVQRLRLQPLGDGGERAVVLDQPHAGHVPVAAVRQRQDRAAARRRARPRRLDALDTSSSCAAELPRDPSTATGMPPASIGRTTPAKHESARPAPRAGSTPMTRARFLRSCSGPPPRAAYCAPASNVLRATNFRHRTDDPPAGGVSPVGELAARARTAAAFRLRPAWGAGHGATRLGFLAGVGCVRLCSGSIAPGDVRTRVQPLPHGDQAGHRQHPHRHVQQPRHVQERHAGQAGADQHDDQPLGPLDDAALAGQSAGLGAGLDVGDHLRGDQADQRRDHQRRALACRTPPTTADRRRSRRRRSGRRWRRAPRRTGCRRRAHGPSRRRACRPARRTRRRTRPTTAGRSGTASARASTVPAVPRMVMLSGVSPRAAPPWPPAVDSFA